MTDTQRFALFFTGFLALWTGMHAYVLSCLWRLPGFNTPPAHRGMLAVFIFLWAAFPASHALTHRGAAAWVTPLALTGSLWLGLLFLSLTFLLVVDAATVFGLVFQRGVIFLRWGALAVAVVLFLTAVIQGLRPPVVTRYEVILPGLPAALDGKVLVQLTDLHLGAPLGKKWLAGVRSQVEAIGPDVLVLTGDAIDGNAGRAERFAEDLRMFSAPLGQWAVTGNHEFYAGLAKCVKILESGGFRVLRDTWAEIAPGLVVSGVDDLATRRRFKRGGDPLPRALSGRPRGAVVFLSHSPLEVERAAALGAGLMLSGHTHNGQVWPFNHVVKLVFPYITGRYDVGGMALIVSRGTGVWGPPMRLFKRSEIVAVTLRREGP